MRAAPYFLKEEDVFGLFYDVSLHLFAAGLIISLETAFWPVFFDRLPDKRGDDDQRNGRRLRRQGDALGYILRKLQHSTEIFSENRETDFLK